MIAALRKSPLHYGGVGDVNWKQSLFSKKTAFCPVADSYRVPRSLKQPTLDNTDFPNFSGQKLTVTEVGGDQKEKIKLSALQHRFTRQT